MASDSPRRDKFARIGGHAVLDLVNTVQWRLSPGRRKDDITDYGDVIRWSQQSGLLADDEVAPLERLSLELPSRALEELNRVRELREAVYSTLFEEAGSGLVLEAYRDAIGHADLDPHGDHWGWTLPLDVSLPRRRIAIEAFDLMTRIDSAQLAQCHDAECGWVFLDTSSRRNRRWCVSADCGNRNRVREYYARSRGDSPSASATGR
jgi:predicted RNA-binding Zn ribbon-like protein